MVARLSRLGEEDTASRTRTYFWRAAIIRQVLTSNDSCRQVGSSFLICTIPVDSLIEVL